MREILLTIGVGMLLGVVYVIARQQDKKNERLTWSDQAKRADKAMN